ncbi:18356_t:CDS:2, partial [Gigaspora margarita]
HALNSVLQDFLVRLSYLQKNPIKWIAGIDHAGIATQSKIEKLKLAKLDTDEGKRAYTLQTWYPQNRKIFTQQWQRLGLLLDYEKARFTLDPTIQDQVKEAFIKLYQDGLIFRGKKLVNWDPQLQSVISDIEVEHRPAQSKLYYLKYPLLTSDERSTKKNINQPPRGKIEPGETPEEAAKREVFEETNLTITDLEKIEKKIFFFPDQEIKDQPRPETIFADVALLVNPHDKRYQKYLGQQIQHPITKKIIPILAEEKVEITFGTGVLKCTPGHDFTDYELGQKHQLPVVSCCDEKGILNELAGE